MSTSLRPSGRAGTLLAAIACGCLAVWALALGFADLAMSRPRAALERWEDGGTIGDVASRRRLLARMGRAIAVNPVDADQRMDLGRFFAWHAARHPRGSERHRFYAELAAARFREAVTARPTWGFAWMLLAQQWSDLGVQESAVVAAMRRGGALAPMEPRVQLTHLWLGLARWQHLSADHRRLLREALSRLLDSREYFREAARIALQHDRQDLLAGALHEPWQRQAFATLGTGRGG